MNIFTMFLFVSFPTAVFIKPEKSDKRKKWFCIVESAYMFLIAVLRGAYSVDMARYAVNFSRVASSGWQDAWNEEYHTGLYVFTKLLSYISDNTQFYYGVLGLIFAVAISLLIYKHSTNPLMSYVLLVPLGYFGFVLTGIAQGLAISLIILAYLCIENKKYLLAFLLIAFASFCHTTAYVALIFFLLHKIKINRFVIALLALAYAIVFTQRYSIGEFIIETAAYSDYAVEISEGGIMELLVYLMVILVSIILIYKSIRTDPSTRMCFLTCVCGALLFTFVPVLTEFFRVAMYFNVFVVVLLPTAISSLYKKDDVRQRLLADSIVYVLFLVMYFGFTKGSSFMNMYEFFWV